MVSKIYQISDDEFKKLIANNYTYSDCLRSLGLTPRGGSSLKIIKKRISELNCSIEHFNQKRSSVMKALPLEEILVENSTYLNTSSLKRRLINNGLLEYKCAICGINEWRGQSLSLHIDHINGKNNDNRLKNLRLLCPNCHSQTETYAGKNK